MQVASGRLRSACWASVDLPVILFASRFSLLASRLLAFRFGVEPGLREHWADSGQEFLVS